MTDKEFLDKEKAISDLCAVRDRLKFGLVTNDRSLKCRMIEVITNMSDDLMRKCVENFVDTLKNAK